jgi:hypothetical protein
MPKVGIVWRAGDWNSRRSMPFELVAALVDGVNVRWYSLQHKVTRDERHPRLRILDFDDPWITASHMRALDLVITIDSMPAHLAGALGIEVWTLLADDADWRWMQDRDDSRWYPTMRLFRQPAAGDWQAVVDQVRRALECRFPTSTDR